MTTFKFKGDSDLWTDHLDYYSLISDTRVDRWTLINQTRDAPRTYFSCELNQVNILDTQFNAQRFIDSQFESPQFIYSNFHHCFFENVTLTDVVIRNTEFINCTFRNLKLSVLNQQSDHFMGVLFENCYFFDSDLHSILQILGEADARKLFSKCVFKDTMLPDSLAKYLNILAPLRSVELPTTSTTTSTPNSSTNGVMEPRASLAAAVNSAPSTSKSNPTPSSMPPAPIASGRFSTLELK